MEVRNKRLANQRMTSDEVSMERSKSFVTALQELKNLRPQLYSAADYCEKSYLHSEQKKKVLGNLKDYAVQALVNVIDHLGTVTCKLTDIMEQQTLDISSMDPKVQCMNQQLLTCQTYMDKEGLKQQQFLAIIPRHHKHYILPNSVSKKVHFSPQRQTDPRQPMQARARLCPSGAFSAKTLSWHLAFETNSTLKGSPLGITSAEHSKAHGKSSGALSLLDVEQNSWKESTPASSVAMQKLGVARGDYLEGGSKTLTPHGPFNSPTQRDITRAPVRSKSMLSAFFVRQKTPQLKTSA